MRSATHLSLVCLCVYDLDMARYLRNRIAGGTYFFTVVTHRRRRFLTDEVARSSLHNVLERVRLRRPFELFSIVLLPDHLHAVWILPKNNDDYSTRWQLIKRRFTADFLASGGREGKPISSMVRCGQRGIWQPRFWEHTCRDEADLKRCVDYLHWNPIKHGLVERVADWPWSSFHQFVKMGEYTHDWGGRNPCPDFSLPE